MNSSKGMPSLLICFALALGLAAGAVWLTAGKAAAATDSVECTDCHDDKQSAKYVHYPAAEGDCEACHEPTPDHLENGGPGGMKTNRTASACLQCHDPKDEGKHVHPALEMEGECVQCHNPHGSDNEKFLVKPENRLCFECHDPVPAEAKEGSEHSVVTDEKSCLNCHNPHSSDHDSLLLNDPKTLCLSCHDREIEVPENGETRVLENIRQKVMELQFPHKPATWDDGCVVCHAPHGSKYKNLLTEPFPVKDYNVYQPGDSRTKNTYELCFTCHNRLLLSREIPADGTGFRNDAMKDGVVVRENLHWFHVVNGDDFGNKNKGRSCIICHDVHGSTNPHIIRKTWPMKNHTLILLFEGRKDGGACLKSCHGQKIYRRIN
jgi:predicted CXXCH cytochrome family protein